MLFNIVLLKGGYKMAKRKSSGSRLGGWAFLVAVILAVIFGAIGSVGPGILWLLVVAGLIVGFLNVTEEETHAFLMSGAVMIIASALGGSVMSAVPVASNILDALLAIFVPAVVVVSVKNVFGLARN
jgi:uncharacterized membrane protein YccC